MAHQVTQHHQQGAVDGVWVTKANVFLSFLS